MKMLIKFLVLVGILATSSANAVEKMDTGFYYPTGSSSFVITANWLERDAAHGGTYPHDEYHVGVDIKRPEGQPIYALADGRVVLISDKSTSGWGPGNGGLVVEHKTSTGSSFIAIYGHLKRSSITASAGSYISAGQVIGEVGDWNGDGDHLHLSIHDGPYSTMASSGWGRLPNSMWPSTNTFTNPLTFLHSHSPQVSCNPAKEKCDIRVYETVGWWPPATDCSAAAQWFTLKKDASGDVTAIGSADKSVCNQVPAACFQN